MARSRPTDTEERRHVRKGDMLEGRVIGAGDREAIVQTEAGPMRVRGAVPGDVLRIEVGHVGRNATWAIIRDIVTPSPERVAVPCGLTELCGGCPWMAWALPAQREEKHARVRALLADVADVVEPVRGTADTTGYRNKLMPVVGGRPGRLRLGLYAPRSHRLVSAMDCPVQSALGNEALAGVRAVLEEYGIAPAREAGGTGTLRRVLVRVAPGTEQIGVALVVSKWPLPGAEGLARRLLRVPGVVSVWGNHQPAATAVALGPTSAPIGGRERLMAKVGKTRYLLSPTAFFQTHGPALPLLMEAVSELLPEQMSHLVDLFAGVGLFALAFADRAERVTAVESDPIAASDLAAAARLQNLTHLRVRRADAAALPAMEPSPDALLLDPPRGGCSEALLARFGADLRPRNLVYVSCAPAALARDLAVLVGHGYRVRRIVPVDLFPHTPHVEVVAALERTIQ